MHTARMLSVSAAASTAAQADLISSSSLGSSPVAAAPASAEETAAVSPPEEQDDASVFVREMFRRHNTSLPNLEGQVDAIAEQHWQHQHRQS